MKNHQYINRGDFMYDVLWNLFVKTGDIRYYNLWKELNKEVK